ncbi:protein kinase family protein [Legionella brunensis]|uniref:Protein kinase domain containing protein n=1 Tax=Legionella brunensis TaxID=29422 RepID=A0A0W0SKZ0_9GAMM|nr:protein kinase family protein [Legionella brunensis]KTC84047.1 protein kinase domain containing protein [Legionella brunensis]
MLSKPQVAEGVLKRPEYLKLVNLIDRFNATKESYQQLVILQQIDMYSKAIVDNCESEFFEKPLAPRVGAYTDGIYAWRHQESFKSNKSSNTSNTLSHEPEQSLEEVLQHYGVHRDGSIFLRSIEFAAAYKQLGITAPQLTYEENETNLDKLYTLLSNRYSILKHLLQETQSNDASNLHEELAKVHIQLFDLIEQAPEIKELVAEHLNILALSYAKIEILQNKLEQEFSEYQAAPLQEKRVNNDNVLFTISTNNAKKDQDQKNSNIELVIRLEDRDNLVNEEWLKSNKVARFFVQDYATFMKQFPGEINSYRPVAISQYAKQGNLKQIAKTIPREQSDVLVEKTQDYFSQISEFCSELIKLNIYHPDIKLTNFLLDNGQVLVSDRKAFEKQQKIKLTGLRTSPLYAPPEFLTLLNKSGTGVKSIAQRKTIDLVPFMTYQVGMALKSFLSGGKSPSTLLTVDLLKGCPNPSIAHKNLVTLSDALTRSLIEHRISLEVFHSMLDAKKLNLEPEKFQLELEKVAGKNPFVMTHAIKQLMAESEDIDVNAIETLLVPYDKSLTWIDHDVETTLIELLKTKTLSSVSYKEFAVKLAEFHRLIQLGSVEDNNILSLDRLVKESKALLKNSNAKGSNFAERLLLKAIIKVENDYEPYLDTVAIRSLIDKFNNNNLTTDDWQQTIDFLNKYLLIQDKKSERLTTSFSTLQKASFRFVSDELAAFNTKKASLFERFLAWMDISPLPNRVVTKEDMETDPMLQRSHLLLSGLSSEKINVLLESNPELATSMVSLYDNFQQSNDKLKQLKEVETALAELLKTKTSSSVSNEELTIKLTELQQLIALGSVEDNHILSLDKLLKETKALLKSSNSEAEKLLLKVIKQAEKDYESDLHTVVIRSLVGKFKHKNLTTADWQQTIDFLNQYLLTKEKTSEGLNTSISALRKASFRFVIEELAAFNTEKASLFERFLAWMNISPLPNRVTKEDMETDPILQRSHLLLSGLSSEKINVLLESNPELATSMVSLYENTQQSYDKMGKLKKEPVGGKAKETGNSDSSSQKKESTTSSSPEESVELQGEGSIVIREDTSNNAESTEEYGESSTIIREDVDDSPTINKDVPSENDAPSSSFN